MTGGTRRGLGLRLAGCMVVAALVGGLLGWTTTGPLYRAQGLLAAPPATSPDMTFPPCPWRGNPPDFLAAALAGSRRVTRIALQQPVWRDTGEDAEPDAAAAFEARRRIVPLTQSPHVLVTFDHPRPEVALAGMRAVLSAAELLGAELHAEEDAQAQALIATERERAAALRAEREGVLRDVAKLTADFGGTEALAVRHLASVEQVLDAEADLARVREAILRGASPDGDRTEEFRAAQAALETRLETLREHARELGRLQTDVQRLTTQAESLGRPARATGRHPGVAGEATPGRPQPHGRGPRRRAHDPAPRRAALRRSGGSRRGCAARAAARLPAGSQEPGSDPVSDPAAQEAPEAPRPTTRYMVALGLLGALAGGLLARTTQVALHRSEGLIRVEPRTANPEDPCGEPMNPMHVAFMAYQVQLLKARRTTLLALETDAWKATGEAADPTAAERFESRRDVLREPSSWFIRVRFDDERPPVALAGVQALLAACDVLKAASNGHDERLEQVRVQQLTLTARIQAIQEELEKLANQGDAVERARLQAELADEERESDQFELLRDQLESQLLGTGTVLIEDRGSLSTEPFDRSRPWAPALGAVAGAGLGLLLVLLAGRRR